ncbi:MAG: sulfatase, partial [Verrucomicrobiota bacterium]
AAPNVLFLAIDDLRPDLGCYGNAEVKTPRIDQLAAEGILFERAYCQQSLCLPSRMSLMSGLSPVNPVMWRLTEEQEDVRKAARESVTTLTEQFRHHGYRAVAFGKIYDSRQTLPKEEVWDMLSQAHANMYASEEANQIQREYRKNKTGKSDRPAFEQADVADDFFADGKRTQLAIQALESHDYQQPFFLAVGYTSPHLPFVAPKKYWDLYDRDALTLTSAKAPPENHSEFLFSHYKEIEAYGHPDPMTEEFERTMLHGYYATASYVDAQIGLLIDELKAQGQYENTVIVVWGDHGFKIGDYGEWAKHTNLELDTRVPLLFRLPEGEHQGRRSKALVELTDIFPTLCDVAVLPVPESVQGRSLLKVMNGEEEMVREAALSQYPKPDKHMGYSIRTERWRYHETRARRTDQRVSQELYDLSEGFVEEVNVLDDFPEVVERHAVLLQKRLDSVRRGGS